MRFKLYLCYSLIVLPILCISQNMQKGFNFLEQGHYRDAELFFKDILKTYPENKTAKLCYGRAIGLQGQSEQAITVFTELRQLYPDDFEIKLNYAEALLWNKDFPEAKTYYETLITENDKSFAVLLGYANTLSNLKIYDEALTYVNKALEVSPGNNNALISKKYIHLGYASQYSKAQNYTEAETILKENLKLFENDKETLLNLANTYLMSNQFDKAEAVYNTLIQKPKNTLLSLNGLALVAHLMGKEKLALERSTEAYNGIPQARDTTQINPTKARYVQALIWNKKYKDAEGIIHNLNKKHPNKNWVLALRATLNIYKSDFGKSLEDYNRILENDSTSFDGNLGKANVLKALGLYEEAYQSAKNTLKFYDNQKDAKNFIKTLNTSFTPFLETKTAYSFDNGNNEAVSLEGKLEFPFSTTFKMMGSYHYRTTTNTVTKNKAKSNSVLFGLSYQLMPSITFNGNIGVSKADVSSEDYTQLLTDVSLHIKPKLQSLNVGYKREIQSFNADLLDREIIMNHIYANYNLSTNINLGWYTQYFYTSQNDDNTRHLLFTSLYYNILSKPGLKGGINYQYITFKNQVPAIYFSPATFNAAEVFINLIRNELVIKPKQWFYELTAATGIQKIDTDNRQGTYRFQGGVGYKFSERCLANFYGTHSNIASATASGFTFTEIGLRFKWYLFNAPIYKIKETAKAQ